MVDNLFCFYIPFLASRHGRNGSPFAANIISFAGEFASLLTREGSGSIRYQIYNFISKEKLKPFSSEWAMCFCVCVYVTVLRQAGSVSCCDQQDEHVYLHTSFNPLL